MSATSRSRTLTPRSVVASSSRSSRFTVAWSAFSNAIALGIFLLLSSNNACAIPARTQRTPSADVQLGVLQVIEPDLQISPPLARVARYWFACVAVGIALALDLLFSPQLEAHRY